MSNIKEILVALPELVRFCKFHPILGIAVISFHYVLNLLYVDVVTFKNLMQHLDQIIKGLGLHHFSMLHGWIRVCSAVTAADCGSSYVMEDCLTLGFLNLQFGANFCGLYHYGKEWTPTAKSNFKPCHRKKILIQIHSTAYCLSYFAVWFVDNIPIKCIYVSSYFFYIFVPIEHLD